MEGGKIEFINTDKAPKAIGPYSQAVISSFTKTVFISGQIAIDPQSGEMLQSSIEEETTRVLENIDAILKSLNLTCKNVIKTTIYLTNIDFFSKMNACYEKYFGSHKPARVTVEVKGLPKLARVEIEAIAGF